MTEQIQAALNEANREGSMLAKIPDIAFSSSASPVSTMLWGKLPQIRVNRKHATCERIVTVDRTDSAHFSFDILRTKMLRIMQQNNWSSVAITSPTAGCGKTVLSLNLAFSFANLPECRTVLLDLDLRQPKVASMLAMEQPPSMEKFLRGEIPVEHALVRLSGNLAVGANNQAVPAAAELLLARSVGHRLAELKERLKPDLLLFDLPPMLVSDDVLAFLPNVDCILLVVAAESSTLNEIDICERALQKETNVLGVVLNKCQYAPETYGY